MGRHQVGLVGTWDVVAFDEVAGIHMNDKDGIQIMKGYMANGSFSRGKESVNANASMVFVGNINGSIENMVRVSHLLSPFPKEMIDTASSTVFITICLVGKFPRCVGVLYGCLWFHLRLFFGMSA
jgi:ATP-dependent Lon protease